MLSAQAAEDLPKDSMKLETNENRKPTVSWASNEKKTFKISQCSNFSTSDLSNLWTIFHLQPFEFSEKKHQTAGGFGLSPPIGIASKTPATQKRGSQGKRAPQKRHKVPLGNIAWFSPISDEGPKTMVGSEDGRVEENVYKFFFFFGGGGVEVAVFLLFGGHENPETFWWNMIQNVLEAPANGSVPPFRSC